MEDLKKIGYEGGKTTHGDVRQAINANSEVANGNFDELSSAVQDVAKTAQGATETAQAADAAAGEAKQTAEAAKGTAEGAAEAAAEAQRVAGAAEEVAEGAAATAEAAQETATGAQSAAETAARDAATAKQDAATAKSDAASAKSTAEGAQSTAETAASNASAALEAAQAAQGTADTAKETAETANGTAGAAKTAADKAAEDAAAAKSDAATAKSTAATASQTAETAKSTAETAKQTAEGAKASVEGLTGDVTELIQQLGEVSSVASDAQAGVTELGQKVEKVSADATGASDGLQQFMSQGILTEAPFPRATAEASGIFAAVGGNVALMDGEIIPWTGWLTLALCYETSDSAAKVKLTGYAGQTLGKCKLIAETAVDASEEPRVVRITGEHDYNPKRIGSPDACMIGSSYHVNVEVKNPNAEFTLLWAVLYESDEYGNPRRRGGSLRALIEGTLQSCTVSALGTSYLTATVYNERTGWFEVNGLVDMTFDDCLLVLKDFPAKTAISSLNNDYVSHARTTNALQGIFNTGINFNFYNDGGETIALGPQLRSSMMGYLYYSNYNNNVIAILSYIRFTSANINNTSALSCKNLESIAIKNISGSFSFAKSPSLSWDSWKYLIDNANEGISEEGITVTVHADVYAKMTGGAVDDWGSLGTLASEKGVKLVAYGESGYPFLTRVLWHGYKRLENKINAAKSGDTIYIHPDDRRKISAAQKDDWAALVTAGAEKRITFALPAES